MKKWLLLFIYGSIKMSTCEYCYDLDCYCCYKREKIPCQNCYYCKDNKLIGKNINQINELSNRINILIAESSLRLKLMRESLENLNRLSDGKYGESIKKLEEIEVIIKK